MMITFNWLTAHAVKWSGPHVYTFGLASSCQIWRTQVATLTCK